MRGWFGALAISACAWVVAGCASPEMNDERALRGLAASEKSVRASSSDAGSADAPAMMIGNRRVLWMELLPMLAEAGGGAVIDELVLDAALEEECRRRGVVVGAREIEDERDRLASALALAGGAGREQGADAADVLGEYRRRRGLGPVRYEAMLRRTAMLRALVRDRVVINDGALRRAYRLRYGTRYDIRVIVTRTVRECEEAARRLEAGADFAEEAFEHSVDASAPVGGLVRGVSVDDLSWPTALRRIVPGMEPGETSGPVSVESGWALVRLERVISPDPDAPPFEIAREELAELERLSQERVLMDAEARRLSAGQDLWLDPRLRGAREWSPR